MTIGSNIKKWREERRFSQGELAQLLDVSQAVISSWESDHTSPKSSQIPELANVLGIEILDLFKGVESINYVQNTDNKDNSVNGFEIHVDAKSLYDDLVKTLKGFNQKLTEENQHLLEELKKLKK
ncbi:MAG: helix-turn-helix domain-containing protein [Bacteroidia bacterium]|nr:helix-turn-helix domain-containing protein [Bacteroidia bacterium]